MPELIGDEVIKQAIAAFDPDAERGAT